VLLALSWRNLWRNWRRTVITLTALAFGVAAIIGLRSYRESTFTQLIQTITTQLVGHIQVHGKGYQEAPEIGNVVTSPETIEAAIAGALPGVRAERRVLGGGLAGAKENSAGVMVSGLQPGTGTYALRGGRHFADPPAAEAVIGVDLAEQLGVAPGGEIVLLGQAADGSTANDRYTVVGISDSGTAELNATGVFLHIADAQELFGLGDGVHQIVLQLPEEDVDLSRSLAAARAVLDLRALEALSWNEMLPELKSTIEVKAQGQYAIDFIIFLIVGLGVLNAMTMSTFERTRELGVMVALGTRPRRLLGMIVLESMLQGALGLLIGFALSVVTIRAIGTVDLSMFAQNDMLGVRMPSIVHLKVDAGSVGNAAITVFATMLLGGLLPAIRAARLAPVEAMRTR
jgi:putative ABC transport system permease protein